MCGGSQAWGWKMFITESNSFSIVASHFFWKDKYVVTVTGNCFVVNGKYQLATTQYLPRFRSYKGTNDFLATWPNAVRVTETNQVLKRF